jgi:hypothetical protein
MKIIFIGTPEFGAIILEKLIKSGNKPFLVITAPDKPVGRKQILTPPPVKIAAENYNIPVVRPDRIKNYAEEIKKMEPDLIILAGRPSMGKTAAAISMCIHPSLEKNEPIAIFSLEMSNEQLVSRMQSYLSGVNVSKIVKKQLSMNEIDEIGKKAIGLKTAPLFIDDTPNISLLDLKGKARKLKKESGIKLIVVDYLQLMRSGVKSTSREQEIAEISRGLKGLAKELNIPVIALSQLSRGVEMRGDKKPMLQDLRESGQIEQDADMVLFCYRPEYYGIDTYEVGNQSFDANGLFMLIIAKHRNGELGEIPLTFIHEQTKLTNHEFGYAPPVANQEENRTFVQQNITIEYTEPLNETPKSSLLANTGFDTEDIFKPDDNDETPF